LKGYYGIKKRKDGKQGSLFWFAIPYRPDEIASAAAVEPVLPFDQLVRSPDSIRLLSKSDKSPSAPLIDPLEILIVDDAPSILKMSSMMLKRQGHQIWTAENGEIALKRIEEKWRGSGKGFDLVLMDLQMPVMDGLEATRRLRAMESEGREWMKYPTSDFHQLIIGLSANSDHDTMKDALKSGVDDFFGKPFALETFNRMVEKFILSRN
jgi:CheY-like chemotaxis protein